MRQPAPPLRNRSLWTLGLWASSACLAFALSACGNSSSASSSPPTVKQQGCTAVSDVLSDGPDPDADPVGYAEAQILPLEHLKLADSNLSGTVRQLAQAYKDFSATNGAKGTATANKVSATEKALNAICPNAAP